MTEQPTSQLSRSYGPALYAFQADDAALSSLLDCLGRVRRVKAGLIPLADDIKAKPLRGRFASLDTAATT